MTAGFADMIKLSEHCKKLGETFSDNLEHIADSLTLWESKADTIRILHFLRKNMIQPNCSTRKYMKSLFWL